ncbi:MAG: amidohydrolase [Clostridia bacterium]|nr:amidohydrolase [Clostridia bacterium]
MLLKNAKIYTMEGRTIDNGFIRIEEGKIALVDEMVNLQEKLEDTLDLKGKSVCPGFIDAHTHLGIFENGLTFEGDDVNEENDPITPHLRAIDAVNPMDECFREAYSSGITTVLVGPGSANPIGGEILAMKTYGRRIDDVILKSPIAIKFALGENPKSVYSEKEQMPMTRMSTVGLIREQLYKAKKYYLNKLQAKQKRDASLLPDFDIKNETLVPLFEKKIQAHFHAHRADDIFTAIRIAKEFDIDCVLVHATEAHLIKEELAKETAKILSGPNLCSRSKPELVNSDIKALKYIADENILFSIITDHPEVPIQHLTMCAAMAIKGGLQKEKALEALTIAPAKICKIDDTVGSIKSGKDADLVVFSGDIFDVLNSPEMVFINGKMVAHA